MILNLQLHPLPSYRSSNSTKTNYLGRLEVGMTNNVCCLSFVFVISNRIRISFQNCNIFFHWNIVLKIKIKHFLSNCLIHYSTNVGHEWLVILFLMLVLLKSILSNCKVNQNFTFFKVGRVLFSWLTCLHWFVNTYWIWNKW